MKSVVLKMGSPKFYIMIFTVLHEETQKGFCSSVLSWVEEIALAAPVSGCMHITSDHYCRLGLVIQSIIVHMSKNCNIFALLPHLFLFVSSSIKLLDIFFFCLVGGGVQAGSPRHVGQWMAYCICPGWLWWWRNWRNEDRQGKPKYSEKTCPSATNPTWPDPGANPGHRGGKPATNRLSYGAALKLLDILHIQMDLNLIPQFPVE
jgi:hypothetical protein